MSYLKLDGNLCPSTKFSKALSYKGKRPQPIFDIIIAYVIYIIGSYNYHRNPLVNGSTYFICEGNWNDYTCTLYLLISIYRKQIVNTDLKSFCTQFCSFSYSHCLFSATNVYVISKEACHHVVSKTKLLNLISTTKENMTLKFSLGSASPINLTPHYINWSVFKSVPLWT